MMIKQIVQKELGMQKIIFNGHTYYQERTGYYSLSKQIKQKNPEMERRLHRAVWKFYNGEIPKGYHIHHKDQNKNNNDISNLELISPSEHSKLHQKTGQNREWWHSPEGKIANKKGRELCKKWHASLEGKQWHSEHQKNSIIKRLMNETCEECGNIFRTFNDTRHKTVCRKCRDKLLKRELRKINKQNSIFI